jgi:hypothetical protein
LDIQNRFEVHCFKYNSPTLLLLQVEPVKPKALASLSTATKELPNTIILGAYIDSEWTQLKNSFWGDSKCTVFELSPIFSCFPSTKKSQNHVFYHSSVGLQFGGDSSPRTANSRIHSRHTTGSFSDSSFGAASPAHKDSDLSSLLFIDNTLQQGHFKHISYGSSNPVFQNDHRRGSFEYQFNVIDIQVYGFSLKALKYQRREWDFEEKEAHKRGDVNVHKMGTDMDRIILELAGVHEFAESRGILRDAPPKE